jgi:hypothetical protein
MFGIKKLKERIKWLENERDNMYSRIRKLENPPMFNQFDQFTIAGLKGEIYTVSDRTWEKDCEYGETWIYTLIDRVTLKSIKVSQYHILDRRNNYTLLQTK